ncbi:hypothetical protein BDFB_003798, partial [Asbolus verrucosus]
PNTIIDQAKTKLDELRTIVETAIKTANNDLQILKSNTDVYAQDTEASGQRSIEEEKQKINDNLETIKNLASSVHLDISSCLNGRESSLENKFQSSIDELKSCISNQDKEGIKIVTNSKDTVDSTISIVDDLDQQLNRCTDSILCIGPIVRQIEVEMVELPVKISTEVTRASQLIETLKPSIDDCSESNVAQYIGDAGAILGEIEDCAATIKGVNGEVNPYDLVDEAKAQLQELLSIVRSTIFQAFRDLDNSARDLVYYRDNALSGARLSIQSGYETLEAQLSTIKNLAEIDGTDISPCLAGNEQALNELPEVCLDDLRECLVFTNVEMTVILNNARYNIDIIINEVNSLPRDIIDEAKTQLEELKRIVQGDIFVAHDDLQALRVDFLTDSDTTVKEGTVEIQQEHETIWAQLQTIKELAIQANKDISPCTNIREELLNRLPGVFIDQMGYCMGAQVREADKFLQDSAYIIDININKVHELEHQLNRCGDSIQCVAPIVTEIDLDMIRLPQNIKTEVQAVGSLLTTLKISVQNCA